MINLVYPLSPNSSKNYQYLFKHSSDGNKGSDHQEKDVLI